MSPHSGPRAGDLQPLLRPGAGRCVHLRCIPKQAPRDRSASVRAGEAWRVMAETTSKRCQSGERVDARHDLGDQDWRTSAFAIAGAERAAGRWSPRDQRAPRRFGRGPTRPNRWPLAHAIRTRHPGRGPCVRVTFDRERKGRETSASPGITEQVRDLAKRTARGPGDCFAALEAPSKPTPWRWRRSTKRLKQLGSSGGFVTRQAGAMTGRPSRYAPET